MEKRNSRGVCKVRKEKDSSRCQPKHSLQYVLNSIVPLDNHLKSFFFFLQVDQGLLYLLTLELTPIKCAQIDCSLDAKICYVKLLVKESVKSEKITDAACKDKDAPKFKVK